MTVSDWIMILAVFAGPIVAVQVTRWLDDRREVRERKVFIFKTLMASRSYDLSFAHVEALNRIDLEFDPKKPKERAVLDAWKAYLDHLNNRGLSLEVWGPKRSDLFVDLLYAMGRVLDYDFDKVQIKNSTYAPQGHSQVEQELREIREGLLKLLRDEIALPIKPKAQ